MRKLKILCEGIINIRRYFNCELIIGDKYSEYNFMWKALFTDNLRKITQSICCLHFAPIYGDGNNILIFFLQFFINDCEIILSTDAFPCMKGKQSVPDFYYSITHHSKIKIYKCKSFVAMLP